MINSLYGCLAPLGGKFAAAAQRVMCVRACRSQCSSTESARCHPLNLYKQQIEVSDIADIAYYDYGSSEFNTELVLGYIESLVSLVQKLGSHR